MFIAKDYVVGEILECTNLKGLLEELQARWEMYQEQEIKVSYYCINGTRYLIAR